MSAHELSVIARPHALRAETVEARVPEGATLAAIVGSNVSTTVRVAVDGAIVPRAVWAQTRPRVGQSIEIAVVPQGGGDDDSKVLRTVALIAVVALSAYTYGAASAVWADWAAAAAAAGVSIAGQYAITALIPPPKPLLSAEDNSFDRARAITGTANRANLYGAIPRVLGKMKYYPPLAAVPVSELVGDAQYLRMLLMLGYGDLELSAMKIGETALSTLADVRTALGTADAPPDLFALDIETDTTTTPVFDANGDSATRTTSADTDEISIDLVFPVGLFGIADDGKTHHSVATFEISFGPVGGGAWQSLERYAINHPVSFSSDAMYFQSNNVTDEVYVKGGARQTLRVGVRWPVARGQYQVRIKRLTATTPGWNVATQYDKASWTVLRSIRYAPASAVEDSVVLALSVRATDQLNGVINQFSLVAQSKLDVWDGSQWINLATSNPAWCAVEVLTGNANAGAIDKADIDADAFKTWANACDAGGIEFNAVIDQTTTAWELLETICATGRAALTRIDGLWSVILDTVQTVPVQHITPRNSWGFSGQRAYPEPTHALRVRFTNTDADYQQDEIVVYDAGYTAATASRFEKLDLAGAMDYEQAWKTARYHLFAARLRPETYTVNMDIENLVARRGDLVKIANDVISVGRGYGRITAITATDGNGDATALETDEALDVAATTNPALRIRTQANASVLVGVSAGADAHHVTLDTATADLNPGDLFLFGESGAEAIDAKITRIDPGPDMSAKLTLVDAAPGIQHADDGPIPPFDSAVTGTGRDCEAPPPPAITAVLGGYEDDGDHGPPADDGGLQRPAYKVRVDHILNKARP